jgi:histidyl-tRNA synthetase
VKLYTIAPMYRYSAPQKGRYREHWQLSVEAIGATDPAIDAEVIQLYDTLLRTLDISDYTLELNSIGDSACRPAYLERLTAWLDEHDAELDEDARAKRRTSPLRVFDTKNPEVARALEAAPRIGESLCDACREHFARVREYLDAYGVRYDLAPTLVRGLDYYVRTTWEFMGEALGAQSSLSGGGRYDGLVEDIGGPSTPGVGFGAGLERLHLALEGQEREAAKLDFFFVVEPAADRARALAQMAKLRAGGLRADADYAGRSLKGQRSQLARAIGFVHVKENGAVVKRGYDAQEIDVEVDEIADRILSD